MKHKIINYIRAGYPGLYLVSVDVGRIVENGITEEDDVVHRQEAT